MRSHLVAVAAFALAFPRPTAAQPVSRFTRIADSSGPILDIIGVPTINSSGGVAFDAHLDSGGQAIFVGNGGPLTTIATTGTTFNNLVNPPAINDNGTVAFLAIMTAGGQGVFTGTGGPLTTIATTNPQINRFGTPSINAAGQVAYVAFPATGSNPQSVFRSDGATIADSNGTYVGGFDFRTSINSTGVVAFDGAYQAGSRTTVVTGSGGPLTTIADSQGPPIAPSLGGMTINSQGSVAFYAGLDAGGFGLFRGNGGPLTQIADTTGSYRTLETPSLNDNGLVLFYADLKPSGAVEGIFSGPDAIADRRIGTGDPLDGSTIQFLHMGSQSLNDAGSFAFAVGLSDGRLGVYRADLVAVPEPSTLVFCTLGGAALMMRRRAQLGSQRFQKY